MFIDELNENINVAIDLFSQDKIIKLESTTKTDLTQRDKKAIELFCEKENFLHYIAIHDIYRQGKKIGFSDKTLNFTISVSKNNRKYQWKNVKILRLTLPDSGPVNLLFCDTEFTIINEREYFRVKMDESATCKINQLNSKYSIKLKDLSVHGMGFTMEEEHVLNEDDDIEVSLKTKMNGYPVTFILRGKIVHSSILQNGTFLVGCYLPNTNDDFLRLLNKKQLENIKKRSL